MGSGANVSTFLLTHTYDLETVAPKAATRGFSGGPLLEAAGSSGLHCLPVGDGRLLQVRQKGDVFRAVRQRPDLSAEATENPVYSQTD